MSTQPIGFFDSGIGGTSIWKEVHKTLPQESSIFLADSKNAPYGEKTKEAILALSIKNTEYLLQQNCKLIVVACNTATTNAIDYLRSHYSIPFIGIEPAIKPAALKTQTKTVGILATKGTLSSSLFSKTSSLYTSGIRVIEQVGEGLVDLIESGKLYSEEMDQLLLKYTQPMLAANIDYLVLGCTHYPYLIPQLKKLLPPSVQIIDSGEAVAKQTRNILLQQELINTKNEKATHQFFTNKDEKLLQNFVPDAFSANVKRMDF
ncbi:glutamate racemase [Pustulibacterium marinum]|uniref:Glutamate racemase n=1 Tax=Pustulibacterium marinum TaxID=1224947 RepID=A0A1I7GRC2_9FLAO|nr:glutamate racemase [Pustulibacterium marinum]SFU50987.1 glutamate racemase [Pustulibacterium marinum]